MLTINNIPISHWGLRVGAIESPMTGYALTGAWSLPKRIGDTHRNWQGEVEPYVLAQDMLFDGRDLTLRLACTASSTQERRERISAFQNELPDRFTLSHLTLGAFEVGLTRLEVQSCGRLWSGLTLYLREPQPVLGSLLPAADGGTVGIDNRSWESLGFVMSGIEGGQGLASWQALSVTVNPVCDVWRSGYRATKSLTLKGTIRGASYAGFKTKVKALQALLSAPGVRRLDCSDGSTFRAFCVDGFDVDVCKFRHVHWGKFTCKMIVV